MKLYLLLIISLLFLSSCTTNEIVEDILPAIPSDAELSSCMSNEDCITLPSQCHPERCINKNYEAVYEKPQACTRIFVVEAAYSPDDCACEDNVCINKNKMNEENDLPIGATKCTFRGEVCTMEYRPVCGFFKKSVQCITEPCAIDAANPCAACGNSDVDYWMEGSCDEQT